MEENTPSFTDKTLSFFKRIPVARYFAERSFIHYTWVGGFFSLISIILLWFFIDILKIPTLVASTLVVGGVFVGRYIFFRILKIM